MFTDRFTISDTLHTPVPSLYMTSFLPFLVITLTIVYDINILQPKVNFRSSINLEEGFLCIQSVRSLQCLVFLFLP